MKPHEIEWLCQHLGHTAEVHKLHYSNKSGYIERVNLSKLFMIQDYNAAAKFSGQDLSRISVQGIL